MKKINLTTVKSVLESLGQIIVIAGIAAVLLCIMSSCENDLIGERTRKNVLFPQSRAKIVHEKREILCVIWR